MQKLFLDLDGVGADWAGYVVKHSPEVESIEQFIAMDSQERDTLLSQFYVTHPRMFYCLPQIKKYQQLLTFAKTTFKGWYILTAGTPLHPNYNIVKNDKRLWAADMFEVPKSRCIVVRNNEEKLKYAQGNILVDDYLKNCDAWNAAGGNSVHVKTKVYDPKAVIAKIRKLV